MKRRALLSVSDKSGIEDFAKSLVEAGWEILSTGGTARAIREAGVEVTDVASAERAGRWFLERGVGAAVVTLAGAGLLATDVGAGLRDDVLAQLPGINLIMILDPLLIFRSDRRCLHDHLAGTQVIQTQSTTA